MSLFKFNNNKKLNQDQAGFTIVELIIVIAIGAMILVIALAVVPAVRRSARDTSRTADINNIKAQTGTYVGNNSNKIPTTAADFQAGVTLKTELSHYEPTTTAVIFDTRSASTTPTANAAWPDIDTLHIWRAAGCSSANSNDPDYGSAGGLSILNDGSLQQIAVVYKLEGDDNYRCDEF